MEYHESSLQKLKISRAHNPQALELDPPGDEMKPPRISHSSNGTRAHDEGEEFLKENKRSSQEVSRGETAKRVKEDRKVP